MSSKKKMSLVPPIYQILVKDGLDHFTVRELRDAYLRHLDIPVTSDTAREAYRMVYRQIVTLLRNDFVIKNKALDGAITYQKTSRFADTTIVEKSPSKLGCLQIEKKIVTTDAPVQSSSISGCDLIETLRHTAHQYQADLLAAVGESEEYQRVAKEHPTLKSLFEADQREATDKSARLLGQLRAIETVLMQHARTSTTCCRIVRK